MEIDYINELHELEVQIKNNERPSSIMLIKDTFLSWYMLVEGISLRDDEYLQEILDRNMSLINRYYPDNSDLHFLRGWMIGISPWFFDMDNEELSQKYLKLAYKICPTNMLFKWALRDYIEISKVDIEQIKVLIANNYEKYYINYKPIRQYFKDVIAASSTIL